MRNHLLPDNVGGPRSKLSHNRRVEIGEARRLKTRQKILAAAFRLLGRESGRATRPDEICTEAMTSRGTFYNHFAGMDELIQSLTREISHAYNLAVHEAVATLPSPADRSAISILCYLHRADVDPAWGWAMVNLSIAGPIFGAETYARAQTAVANGLECGDFNVPNPSIGRDMMLGTCLATMISILRQDSVQPELVVKQILRGLGASERTIERSLSHPMPDIDLPSNRGGVPL